MAYSYTEEKPKLFTEEGQVLFLKIRDKVEEHLRFSGAVRMQEVISECLGATWGMLACVDRLVELKELKELTGTDVPGQYRIFTEV